MRAQDQAIVASDRSLMVCYWRLGLALNLARRHFGQRQWGLFLEELGINKTPGLAGAGHPWHV